MLIAWTVAGLVLAAILFFVCRPERPDLSGELRLAEDVIGVLCEELDGKNRLLASRGPWRIF